MGNLSIRTGAITRIIGRLVLIEGAMMALPLAICLLYGEGDWRGFAVAVAAAAACGGVCELLTRRHRMAVRAREGFIITAAVWFVFGLFGVIPLMLSAHPLGFTDAMFEVISGFTTTGASVVTDLDAQSHGVLFWRALTQWIGGLGIILFMLAVLPELNKAVGMSMFNAEATGITHGKLHPRIRQTALSLWIIYIVLTLVSIVLLWVGPMDLFDSVCQTFAAVATGGFTTHNAGIGYWHSDYVVWVLTVVMFVAGVNFMLIYGACCRGPRELLRNSIFRLYGLIVGVSLVLLSVAALLEGSGSFDRVVAYPLFHIVSAITTTGFGIDAIEGWGSVALAVTILLMLCGACAGSTAGGLKVDRIYVLWRNVVNEVKRTVFPKRTYVVTLNGSPLESNLISRVTAFVAIYLIVLAAGAIFCCFFGYSFQDSLFMVSSAIGCNGLGYGATGIGGGYALLPAAIKWLMVGLMLLGRLELFTFLVLLVPSFWRR